MVIHIIICRISFIKLNYTSIRVITLIYFYYFCSFSVVCCIPIWRKLRHKRRGRSYKARLEITRMKIEVYTLYDQLNFMIIYLYAAFILSTRPHVHFVIRFSRVLDRGYWRCWGREVDMDNFRTQLYLLPLGPWISRWLPWKRGLLGTL